MQGPNLSAHPDAHVCPVHVGMKWIGLHAKLLRLLVGLSGGGRVGSTCWASGDFRGRPGTRVRPRACLGMWPGMEAGLGSRAL